MLTIDKIYNQINRLTIELISTGLCDEENFPSRRTHPGNIEEIGVSNADHSVFLKNIPYFEMFRQLIETRTYNMKMIDGALISMSYKFKGSSLTAHRLSFFPSPNLEMFQNNPELYMNDELYSDIIDKRIVTVPIRFDFDNNENIFKPIIHPISHLTLGQYKHCRIPVSTALTPYQFLTFVIANFYHNAYEKRCKQFTVFKDCFTATIFEEEKELLHMNTPMYKT
ncbi:MAG: DUF2290 domain-containing protein [Chitinispirillales bacterium]|nr:DUF2290 domain-containing protein [Chitinispirillales bacterium]